MITIQQISNKSCIKKIRKTSSGYSSIQPITIHQQTLNTTSHKTIGNLIASLFSKNQNQQQWISLDYSLSKVMYVDIQIQQCRFSWMKKQNMLKFIGQLDDYPRVSFKDVKIFPDYLDILLGSNKQKERKVDKSLSFEDNLLKYYQSFQLTEQQLFQNNYPNIQMQIYKDFKTFTKLQPNTKKKLQQQILCIDCQMVQTQQGLQLGRISIVNFNLQTIYDSFVKPSNHITNYNTKYSGLTRQILQNVTTTLQDIQLHLSTIIHEDTILVGHSLQNDLRVLKIIHRHVIDTAVMFMVDGRKQQLKNLVFNYFKKSIQKNTHNSIQDCKYALSLAKLHIDILSKLNEQNQEQQQQSSNLLQQLQILNKTISLLDQDKQTRLILNKQIVKLLSDHQNDDKTLSDLIIKQFRYSCDFDTWKQYYQCIDVQLAQIHNTVPANTLIIYNFQIKKSYTEIVLGFYYEPIVPYAVFQIKNN